jgi:hypothetical protein
MGRTCSAPRSLCFCTCQARETCRLEVHRRWCAHEACLRRKGSSVATSTASASPHKAESQSSHAERQKPLTESDASHGMWSEMRVRVQTDVRPVETLGTRSHQPAGADQCADVQKLVVAAMRNEPPEDDVRIWPFYRP